MSELARIDTGAFSDGNPIGEMLQALTDRGVTPDTVGAMERLTDLYIKMEDRNAAKAFTKAKSALQAELEPIIADKMVPNRGKYATYRQMMKFLQPYLTKHEFSVSCPQSADERTITATCRLSYGEFTESTPFTVRIEPTAKGGMTLASADGGTFTTAQRRAVMAALNIVIEDERDDARMLGAFISSEQAESLRTRVAATNADEKKFFARAQAESYETIRTGMYAGLDAALLRKEAAIEKGGTSS